MQIIQNWINGSQNFTVGSLLYKTLGKNQALKDLLAKGETAFVKGLLLSEFEKIINPPVVSRLTPRPLLPEREPTATEASVMPDSADEVLKSLKAKWIGPYQKMNYLRHKLDKEFDDIDSMEAVNYRKSLVFEILSLEQECMQVWKERAYYLKHGKLANVAESKTEIPKDAVELAGLINNLKKNIRRNRKLMIDNPENPLYAQLYNDYKTKHKEITGREYEEKL